jgi:hypothetical protein
VGGGRSSARTGLERDDRRGNLKTPRQDRLISLSFPPYIYREKHAYHSIAAIAKFPCFVASWMPIPQCLWSRSWVEACGGQICRSICLSESRHAFQFTRGSHPNGWGGIK